MKLIKISDRIIIDVEDISQIYQIPLMERWYMINHSGREISLSNREYEALIKHLKIIK
jgi:hypothetical protein